MAGYRRPVSVADRERREQAQADQLTALHERLAEQVQALRTGEDWQRWLQAASRFHSYSFNNILLILAQRPDATAVAGFKAWKSLGRQVDKGQRGLQVLAPVVRRTPTEGPTGPTAAGPAPTDSTTGGDGPKGEGGADSQSVDDRGQRKVAGFRVAHVFDVSQTSGKPLPERPMPVLLAGKAPAGLWDALAGLVSERGFTLVRGDCDGANGLTDYAARTVRVRGDVDDAQAVKTLAHEVGHVLLHDPNDLAGGSGAGGIGVGTSAHCRGVKEVEAESLAFLVAAGHGLDTAGYTFAYVAGWAETVTGTEPETVVRNTGQRVLGAARTVLAVTQDDTQLDTVAAVADTTVASLTQPSAAVSAGLGDRVRAGADRTAGLRDHAETVCDQVRGAPSPSAAAAAAAAGVRVGDPAEVLLRMHADAAAFYATQLTGGPGAARAAAFLTSRGVPAGAVDGFGLGYAPPGWTALTSHLRAAGYTDGQLLDAGLIAPTRRGGVVDRFRDRVMFPVHDPDRGGAVVAFIGRTLAPGPDVPKYLNSPETALYSKSGLLYGLGAAPTRTALAAGGVPVLVEGALDAIAVTSAGGALAAGGNNPRWVGVAPSGTALTTGQVTALATHAGPLAGRGVVVAFDGDPSGRHAAVRSYGLLRAAGGWPTAAGLPDGQDPASIAQHDGPATLGRLLDAAAAVPLVDLVIDEHLATWAGRLHWAEGRTGALRDAAAIVAAVPPEHVARQVLRLAARLELNPATVTAAVLEQVGSSTADRDTPAPSVVSGPGTGPAEPLPPVEPLLPVELARADHSGPLRLYSAARTEVDRVRSGAAGQASTAQLGTAAGPSTASARHAPGAGRTGR